MPGREERTLAGQPGGLGRSAMSKQELASAVVRASDRQAAAARGGSGRGSR